QNMLGQRFGLRFGCSAFDARRFEGLHIGERVDGHLSPLLRLFSSLIGEVLAVRKRYPFATWCPARCSRTRTSPEWSQPLPPNAAAALNNSCVVAVFGNDRLSARAPDKARLRSFWCNSMRKPGSMVRLIMRSPCTSRTRDEAKP